jgi:lysophospholipase L1-like esterase
MYVMQNRKKFSGNQQHGSKPIEVMMQRRLIRWAVSVVFVVFGFLGALGEALGQSASNVDLARLQHVLAKARRGERVTIGVIGGSITAGAMASTAEKRYGNLVAQWWRDTFPKADVQFINAGIGATGSNYGALRADRDLLKVQPDFIVAEYSVNDPNIPVSADSFEGLIRHFLAQPNQPAVFVMYMMSEGGKNTQEQHAKVVEHYRLPNVSFRDKLWPEMEAGKLKWGDYIADCVHPNDKGHAFAAQLITEQLAAALQALPADDQLAAVSAIPAPRFTDIYEHTALYEANALKPVKNEGWAHDEKDNSWKADKPGSRIEFEIEGRAILFMDFHIRGPMGRAKIQVDDRPAITREAWFEPTWGGYRQTDEIARDLPPGKHRVTVEILPEKHPESTGHEFRIFGLGAAGVASPAK